MNRGRRRGPRCERVPATESVDARSALARIAGAKAMGVLRPPVIMVASLASMSTSFATAPFDDGGDASVRPVLIGLSLNQAMLEPDAEPRAAEAPGNTAPPPPADFADARSVAVSVLSSLPAENVVYPTEGYFYYMFPLGERLVSGNLRFSDIDRGTVSVGYFDFYNNRDTRSATFRDGEDGVEIAFDPEAGRVRLSIDGVGRAFTLDDSAFTTPSYARVEGERLISGIRDESGYYLYLHYHRASRSFYYVLNPDEPPPERWDLVRVGDMRVYFGARSRFCFYHHEASGRYVLVGVHRRNVWLNTWYDGPFDQVPPRLAIGEILEEAYPYVLDAGGIDDHGRFLERAGQRVAISPYIAYRSGPELIERLARVLRPGEDGALAWTGATYEWKKDWRADRASGEFGIEPEAAHELEASRGWPANHWGRTSRMWPTSHSAGSSARWPANHERSDSREAEAENPIPD